MNATELQKQVIESSANKKNIVMAGPGNGKTFCLIERLKYLVKEEKLEPATEILVLSFSVAASLEIKNRLIVAVEEQGYDDELLYVSIRTFDSFASSFMCSLNNEILFDGRDYDQRIAMATEIIRNQEDAIHRLKRYRHIMVDEVQDLVGVRASLTLAILNVFDGGFTLFGDPAQAVYNFLMDENEKGLTSDEFLEKVYSQTKETIENFFLSENFRVGENKNLKDLAYKGRNHLLNSPSHDAYTFLRQTFADLPQLGSLQDAIIPQSLNSSKTAFLCRTNGQILRLARHFNDQGIEFTIRKPLNESEVSSWVGRLFLEWDSQTVKKNDFIDKIIKSQIKIPTDPNKLWNDLLKITKAKSSVRMPQLRNALLEDGLFAVDASDNQNCVILSTVHRSKGREFDNVVLTIPEETSPEKFLDEGRVMFVGLTRARCTLHKMSEKGSKGIWKSGERWLRTTNTNGKQHLTGIEVGYSGDIDSASFVSLEMFDDHEEIEENQNFLWEIVRPGMPAKLKLSTKSKNSPIYEIWTGTGDDVFAVGLTSSKFGYSLKNIIIDIQGSRTSKYPEFIDELWVQDIVTEIGNLGNTDVPRKYRNSGLWLGLRLQGLGTCRGEWRRLS